MGVLVDPAPPGVLVPIAVAAEELGYDYLYVSDQGTGCDIYVVLGALAVQTKRIRLGPGVTNPYTRHPAVTASAIATLNDASGGRAFLGVGAGGARALGPLGLERQSPVLACTELVTTARTTWRDPIEVHWAARGPRMLAAGARVADVMILNGISHRELPQVVSTIDDAVRGTGRRPRLQYGAALVFDPPSREALRARTAFRIVDSPRRARAALCVSDETHAELRRALGAGGPAEAATLVDDRLLAEYVIDGASDPVEELRALVDHHRVGGLTVDISDIPTAIGRLEAAADVFQSV